MIVIGGFAVHCRAHKPSYSYKDTNSTAAAVKHCDGLFCCSVLNNVLFLLSLANKICSFKGYLSEAKLKFFIITQPKEIGMHWGHFSKKVHPLRPCRRGSETENWPNSQFHHTLTQQTKSVPLWIGIKPVVGSVFAEPVCHFQATNMKEISNWTKLNRCFLYIRHGKQEASKNIVTRDIIHLAARLLHIRELQCQCWNNVLLFYYLSLVSPQYTLQFCLFLPWSIIGPDIQHFPIIGDRVGDFSVKLQIK